MADPVAAIYVSMFHFLKGGLTLKRMFALIEEESDDPRVREAARALAEPVSMEGFEVETLAEFPDLFPPVARMLLWAGCQAGALYNPIGVAADPASLVLPSARAAGGAYPFVNVMAAMLRFGVPPHMALDAVALELGDDGRKGECKAMAESVRAGASIPASAHLAPSLLVTPQVEILSGADGPNAVYEAFEYLASASSLGVAARQDARISAADAVKRFVFFARGLLAFGHELADAIGVLSRAERHPRMREYLAAAGAGSPASLCGAMFAFGDLFTPSLVEIVKGLEAHGRLSEGLVDILEGMRRGLFLPRRSGSA